MKDLETPSDLFETLVDRAESFAKTTIELSKFKTLEAITLVVTTIVARLSVILAISLFVLVLNIGIALWLGEILGKSYYGFFIVAGFYLLAGLVMKAFLYGWIKKPISEIIIVQALQ